MVSAAPAHAGDAAKVWVWKVGKWKIIQKSWLHWFGKKHSTTSLTVDAVSCNASLNGVESELRGRVARESRRG